ncbi:hypothetical protein [Streptomyces sp. SM13]|uniref:hypothetical protein n=1 Tax=Streptomyces sp. SM13 TaxID=1983803 RepID=UPI000CD5C5AC|nr:hypothetical protein [Streptomyces sp. SM13]
MDIRPQDLPELRAEIVSQRDAIGPSRIASLHTDRSLEAVSPGLSDIDMAVRETTKLVMADLYHISEEMTQLAIAAAGTLPPFSSDAEDYPSAIGFAFFNGGIPARWGDVSCRVHAASWQVLGTGAMVAFFIDLQSIVHLLPEAEASRQIAELGTTSDGLWFNDIVRVYAGFNEGVSEQDAAAFRSESGVAATVMPALRATLLLMQQPLAVTSEVEPDRAARKRLRRAGREPKPVRVIELRRPKGSGEKGDSSREYRHQWITRGHWRQHWYPKRQVHRPVWIAPHIKGPEGAPLIGGEKVYAWKR